MRSPGAAVRPLLLWLLLSPCDGYVPCGRPRSIFAALPGSRHEALFMDEAQPGTGQRSSKQPLLSRLLKPFRRFRRGAKVQYECGVNKYGCDPRGPDVSQAAASILGDAPPPQRPPATEFEPGAVNELNGGIAMLSDILQRSAASERMVVIKFKRKGCMACASSVEPLASAARAWADRVDFFEVDYHESKALCTACAIKVVPCTHLYMNGTLVDTMPLGPSTWSNFAERVEGLAGEPAGEVVSPKVKPKAIDESNPFMDPW